MGQKILVLSYTAGFPGSSPAEWLDDKVHALSKLGHEVILITFLSAKKNTSPGVRHYRVPSISLSDFKIELQWLKENNEQLPFYSYFFFILAYTFGFLFDRLFILMTKGMGEGRPSWTISALVTAIYALTLNRIDVIFSTGGPASSHLAGVICGFILRTPVIVELQDPLFGAGIGRAGSSGLLFKLEKLLIKRCKKVVYVTKQAALEAKERHKCENAVCIYPGSRDFNIIPTSEKKNKFRFLHLGTLYSNRSLYTLVQALDQLIERGQISADDIELINLGNVFDEHRDSYKNKSYFQQLPIRPRQEAIRFAAQSDVNLIIQHTDPRSTTTIPYKTYDYFNLDCQILGLTNSHELTDMLHKYGYQATSINNVDAIAVVVLKMIKGEIKFSPPKNRLKILDQVTELIH